MLKTKFALPVFLMQIKTKVLWAEYLYFLEKCVTGSKFAFDVVDYINLSLLLGHPLQPVNLNDNQNHIDNLFRLREDYHIPLLSEIHGYIVKL